MADITLAMPFLLLNEDGKDKKWFYQTNLEAIRGGDPGGETIHGIARYFWPTWSGWKIVDSFKGVTGFPQILLKNQIGGICWMILKNALCKHWWTL